MNQPQPNVYPAWAQKYISLVEGDVLNVLERQASEFPDFIKSLTDKADFAYEPGKWTIKQLIGHMIDTERILVYRLTCIARGEQANLPGFDEDSYVVHAHFHDRSLHSLSEEFAMLRKGNMYLFNSLQEEELNRCGIANGLQISVGVIRHVIAGHVIHHTRIIKERYLL
ncbi:MAG: hypothetical protein JWQ28_389 [Pedobacter sp.]|jgi:hypothetical protein|nr:hypothetical protein [Pedobacter sp.]